MLSLKSGLGLLMTIAAFTLLPLASTQLVAKHGDGGGRHGGGGHHNRGHHGGGHHGNYSNYRNFDNGPYLYRGYNRGWNTYNDNLYYPYYNDPYYDNGYYNDGGLILRFGF